MYFTTSVYFEERQIDKLKRIALIIPYFGSLPNYFSLWLESASYNKSIDFLLFTDCNLSEYGIPDNVICKYMTLQEIANRINGILDFDFILHNSYKLCDYRPLYGLIFSDYIYDYQFWGHCDLDIIWGNLSNYITEELLDKYDRLYVNAP